MNKKVLIIDDNKGDRMCLSMALKDLGCPETLEAETGEQGVESCRTNQPDIVVLDTILPKMNGFETCRAIKALPGKKPTVVLLTGVPDAVSAGFAREAGADKYTIKTVEYEEFKKCVRPLLA